MDHNLKIALIILAILFVLLIIVIGLYLYFQRKNVLNALKEVFPNSNIEKGHAPYDFKVVCDDETYLFKYISIPKASCIAINYQYTWQLFFGGNPENKGRAYPKTRFLNEVIPFCKDSVNEHEHKVCIIYKKTEHIDKYINEHEMVPVNIIEHKYSYYLVQYDTLLSDMKVVFDDTMNHK